RYCKPECRRLSQERLEARALMAEAGMSIDKRQPCQRCGKPIPRWRNGRAVRKDAKTCDRCRRPILRALFEQDRPKTRWKREMYLKNRRSGGCESTRKSPAGAGLKGSGEFQTTNNSKRVSSLWPFHGREADA